MVSTTAVDQTEKLGITLPISLLQKLIRSVETFQEAHSSEELLRVI
jgi:hypothetical protein